MDSSQEFLEISGVGRMRACCDTKYARRARVLGQVRSAICELGLEYNR
jgi:hypothetical protein